jgi:hypothetical protein
MFCLLGAYQVRYISTSQTAIVVGRCTGCQDCQTSSRSGQARSPVPNTWAEHMEQEYGPVDLRDHGKVARLFGLKSVDIGGGVVFTSVPWLS